jgi:hypothetical protein
MRNPGLWLIVCILAGFCACRHRAVSIRGNIEGYDFDHPQVIELPAALNEISGLWYYHKDSSLFAIVDNDGFLYKIFPHHLEKILRWRFHGHGDFEDVCMVDSTFYVLRSDGVVFATHIQSGDSIQSTKYEVPEKGNEFESIYYDDSLKQLILVCKECPDDNNRKRVST